MDEELYEKYNQAMMDGDYKKALSLLEEELEKKPKSKVLQCILLYQIGFTYRFSGDFEKAKEYYNKALKINPSDSGSNQGIGIIYQQEGNYKKSIEHLNKAIKTAKSGVSKATFYNSLGLTYRLKGDYDKALESYFEGISNLFEEICDELEKRGSVAMIPHREVSSWEWLKFSSQALLKNTAKHGDIKNFLIPNVEDVNRWYKEDKPIPCWIDSGGNRLQTSQYMEAVRVMLMSNTSYAHLTNNIGVVYSTIGNKEEAIKWYKESIALTPDNMDYPDPRMGLETLENE